MRYYIRQGTLLLRGIASAAGTGLPQGGCACTALLLSTASTACPGMPAIDLAIARNGLARETSCGREVGGDVAGTVVAQYDRTMAFALADGDTVAVIAWAPASIPAADTDDLLEEIAAACAVPPAAVIFASDGEAGIAPHGPLCEAASAAVREALERRGFPRREPSFLIYSRFGGGHWVAWTADGCPYYPCHHRADQRCDFCYCPLYPCGDASLGEEVASSTAGAIWNCSACTLLHEPAVADHLRRNPMASLAELKRVAARL